VRAGEAGFTLVEALSAIVILVFGLIGITNLMIVAASSNTAANQGTAASAVASELLESLKAVPFTNLTPGGSVAADTGTAVACSGAAVNAPGTLNNCDADVQGVGRIHTRWAVTAIAGNNQIYYVQVRAEALGGLAPGRTRAEFTTFRSCTSQALGCPAP
jgi:hypothetical protein